MIPDNLGNESIIYSNKHQQIISILSYVKVNAISLRTLFTLSSRLYVTRIKKKHMSRYSVEFWKIK